jgi:hypothetical protein
MTSYAVAFQFKDGKSRPTPQERFVKHNEYGHEILDSSGNRINYSKKKFIEQSLPPIADPRSVKPKAMEAPQISMGGKQIWSYAAFGSGIGSSNIIVAQNGVHLEVYLGGSGTTFGPDTYWHVLRYNPSTNDYRQMYVSHYYPTGIRRIEVADIIGSSQNEILVALEDGRIEVYDQTAKSWLAEIVTAAVDLKGFDVSDVDTDGENEIILCTSSNLYVYSGNGVLEWELADVGGSDVVVGQMDADDALEIAVTDGNVIDTATKSVQWKWESGFGAILEAEDIDGDDMDELIAAERWYFVWAYDVDRELAKWSIQIFSDIGAIHVTDVDDDSVMELLVGEGQWGAILAFNTVTQEQEWSIDNPEHGVTDVATGDIDNDGDIEVVWGAGASSTGEDHLYVANWQTQQIEWQNIHLDGPFIGPEMGDLDGDGRNEMVVVSWESDSGYGSGRILVFNGFTLKLLAISDEIVGGSAWTGTHDLDLYDVDNDGRMEIVVAADRLYDGIIEIYDYEGFGQFNLNWTNSTRPFGASFYSVKVGDVDSDGFLEVVGGSGREHTGAEGVFIYVYDYNTGEEEWHSLQMGEYWDAITDLALGDVDLDGFDEIIGMVGKGDVYVFDGPSKVIEDILSGSHTTLELFKFRVGKISLMFLGDDFGDISAGLYLRGSYLEIYRNNFVSGSIDGLSFFPRRNVFLSFGTGGTLNLASLNGTLWQSHIYGEHFGARTVRHPLFPICISAGSYSILGFYIHNQ